MNSRDVSGARADLFERLRQGAVSVDRGCSTHYRAEPADRHDPQGPAGPRARGPVPGARSRRAATGGRGSGAASRQGTAGGRPSRTCRRNRETGGCARITATCRTGKSRNRPDCRLGRSKSRIRLAAGKNCAHEMRAKTESTMQIRHHLTDGLLMAYAAGHPGGGGRESVRPGVSRTHVSLCDDCPAAAGVLRRPGAARIVPPAPSRRRAPLMAPYDNFERRWRGIHLRTPDAAPGPGAGRRRAGSFPSPRRDFAVADWNGGSQLEPAPPPRGGVSPGGPTGGGPPTGPPVGFRRPIAEPNRNGATGAF